MAVTGSRGGFGFDGDRAGRGNSCSGGEAGHDDADLDWAATEEQRRGLASRTEMETTDRAFGFSRGDATVRLGLDGAERRREEGYGRWEMVGGLLRTEGEEEWRSAVAANG